MFWIMRIFGPPHELLHLLGLWLVGRRAVAFSWRHVDIPPDLSLGEYLFVAGLPALVFWGAAGVGLLRLLNADGLNGVIIGGVVLLLGVLGGLGTVGDLHLMMMRWMEERQLPPQ